LQSPLYGPAVAAALGIQRVPGLDITTGRKLLIGDGYVLIVMLATGKKEKHGAREEQRKRIFHSTVILNRAEITAP